MGNLDTTLVWEEPLECLTDTDQYWENTKNLTAPKWSWEILNV